MNKVKILVLDLHDFYVTTNDYTPLTRNAYTPRLVTPLLTGENTLTEEKRSTKKEKTRYDRWRKHVQRIQSW